MIFRPTLLALLLAAAPLAAQEATAPAPAPQAAPSVALSATPSGVPDLDCTDQASLIAAMEGREIDAMGAIREFCVQEFVRRAEALGTNAKGEDAFDAALARLDLEIATLKVFQADLLSGGRIDNAMRRTETEIEALQDEVRLQQERGSPRLEENLARLEEMSLRYTESRARMDELKAEVDASLADLLDDAPDIALSIRLDGLEAAIASQEGVVEATSMLMENMLSFQNDMTGQETN